MENFRGIRAGVPVEWNDDETLDDRIYAIQIAFPYLLSVPGESVVSFFIISMVKSAKHQFLFSAQVTE